ncbi:MAG: response regulator [Bacteroidota bacterium]|nr:response regulator [Bacteroidota bacterium]
MNNELTSLLQKAYNDGIITSINMAKILKAKEELKISDAEFHQLDDQIRISTYLKKVEERKEKGVVYFGDLTKQYKISEEEKILLKEKKDVETQPTPPTLASIQQEKIPEEVKVSSKEKKDAELQPTPPSIQQEKLPEEVKTPSKEKKAAKVKLTPSKPQPDTVAAEEKIAAKEIKDIEPQPAPTVTQQEPAESPAGERVPDVVLIVDDNHVHITTTKTLLEKNGYVCYTADSPEQGYIQAVQMKPSIILSDFNFGIGKKTGLELYQELKSSKITIPFIIITAYFQKEFVDYSLGIGITDYLTKPFDPEILLSTIKEHLSVKKNP